MLVITPPLFSLYSEEAINKIKEETKNTGVKVQGNTIKILCFADDISLLANTKRVLEEALNLTETVFNKYNMKINIVKTKATACRTNSEKKGLNIKIGNERIREIDEFHYLGTKITRNGRCNTDIRSRIGQAKKALAKIPQLLVSNIDLEIRP